jgi:hypothetical protein
MTDWKKKQRECKKCNGVGYIKSFVRHADSKQPHTSVALCECQPKSLPDLEEATKQKALTDVPEQLAKALEHALPFVELVEEETDREEAADARWVIETCIAALAAYRAQQKQSVVVKKICQCELSDEIYVFEKGKGCDMCDSPKDYTLEMPRKL